MALLQHPAPERTLNLEEIIPCYDFILMDNCLLKADQSLSEHIYMVKQPSQLLRFTERFRNLVKSIEEMQGYLSKYQHLYLTPEVKEEMFPFAVHLRQVAWHHQSKLPQIEQDWHPSRGRPKFSRHNRRRNKLLERQSEEGFDFSEYNSTLQQTLDLIHRAADSLDQLAETFPVYQRSYELSRITVLKASMADASLIAAMVDYAKKEEHQSHTAAILTADGDIIKLFHKHLLTLPYAEQRSLSPRVAVYFQEPASQMFRRFVYNIPYRVQEGGV